MTIAYGEMQYFAFRLKIEQETQIILLLVACVYVCVKSVTAGV